MVVTETVCPWSLKRALPGPLQKTLIETCWRPFLHPKDTNFHISSSFHSFLYSPFHKDFSSLAPSLSISFSSFGCLQRLIRLRLLSEGITSSVTCMQNNGHGFIFTVLVAITVKIMIGDCWHVLGSRYIGELSANYLTHITSFTPNPNTVRWPLDPFYRWEHWGREIVSFVLGHIIRKWQITNRGHICWKQSSCPQNSWHEALSFNSIQLVFSLCLPFPWRG